MESLFKDIRYGFRSLWKRPGFTAIALTTLALGIGANTAIFSVVNAVLLRPLPYPNADRLVALSENSLEAADIPVAYPDYLDWRAQQSVFEEMSARLSAGGVITGNDPERVIGRLVTASFFSTLGVQPFMGRGFLETEDRPGGPRVIVLSYGLWQRRFGTADPIGKSISYNGEPWTVVGVMPAGFDFYGRNNISNDFLIPLGSLADQNFMKDRNSHVVRVTARLKPGMSLERAAAELNAVAGRLATQYPATNTGVSAMTRSLLDDYIGDVRRSLLVIFAAGAFMLLIACANVANLMLARATTRRKEIALRLAVGASRWRIARQLLTESLILAMAGGAFGVLLATWGVNPLSKLNTETLSRMDEVSIDARVLGFTLLITLSVGILFGLFPALQGSGTGLADALKEGGRAVSAGAGGRLRRWLVVTEVALAFIVLIGAGLTLKSFARLTAVDPGFDPQNLLTFRMRLPDAKYREMSQALAFDRAAMARVSTLPGVERVAVSTGFPLGRASDTDYIVEGQPAPLTGQSPVALRQDISEDYHKVLNIPLLEGRLFTAYDTETTPLVVIVDEELAARSFPNQPLREIIGKRLRIAGDGEDWREIVGVVRHVKQNGLDEESRAQIYRPLTQIRSKSGADFARATDMIVKTSVEPYSLIGAIKNEIRAIDKDQPIAQVQTLNDKLRDSVAPQRFTLQLLGLFGVIALLLASAGIYGVMSYAVTQRTHEIGIRMALGAQMLDVLKLVVKGGMSLTLIGVAIGLGGAVALTRLMSRLLFGVTPTDPLTFVCVAIGLTLVALIACYIPARRATKVDPLVALRYE
jgi:putative ABC transport system permease protein